MSYYERSVQTHLDGTPIFKTAEDEQNEKTVAAMIEEVWSCQLHAFGKLSAVDWYAERDGRPVGVLELKSRSHTSDAYPTVFLNVRKWLALMLASLGMNVPPIFVVKFTDRLMWIALRDVETADCAVAGCLRIVKSRSDVEPVIGVPVRTMKELKPAHGDLDASRPAAPNNSSLRRREAKESA